jgi:autotransporter passenger strand-loop-strand repeat protein
VSGGAQLVRSGGTASDTVISAGSEIVSAGGSTVGMTIGSGATAIIMPGAFGVVQSGGTFADSGTLVNSGTINVADGGTLALYAPVVSNKGTVSLSGTGSGVGATLLLDPGGGAVLLSGGGKIVLSSSGNNLVSAATAVTLTNLDNTAGECAKRHRHARGGDETAARDAADEDTGRATAHDQPTAVDDSAGEGRQRDRPAGLSRGDATDENAGTAFLPARGDGSGIDDSAAEGLQGHRAAGGGLCEPEMRLVLTSPPGSSNVLETTTMPAPLIVPALVTPPLKTVPLTSISV